MLSNYAKQRLINASSRGKGDIGNDIVCSQIDQVLYELHGTEPSAFLTTAHKNEEGEVFFNDNNRLLDERNFHHQPQNHRITRYKSFVIPKKHV